MKKWNKLERRLVVYSSIFFCLYVFIALSSTLVDISELEKSPSPFGVDFAVYYTAGQMIRSEESTNIYNMKEHHYLLEEIMDRNMPFALPWVYPPTFLLAVVPFSFLPYYISLALWLLSTFVLAIYAMYLLVPKAKLLVFITFGFPGVLLNLRWGQNGFLNTALLGFGICFLETNPMISGIMFGLLTYKPQIALFPFVILLLAKKWRPLLWSIFFAVINVVISVLVFGYSTWIDFFNNFFNSSSLLLTSVWEDTAAIQPTVYSTFRIWGVEGINLQIILSIIAVISTMFCLWTWKKTDRTSLKGTVLIIGIFLTMPYYVQYDLMILSIPCVLLAYDFFQHGYFLYEIILLGVLWCMPLINWPLVAFTGIQINPIVLFLVLTLVYFRVSGVSKRCTSTNVF